MIRKFWTPGLGGYLVRHPLAILTLIRAGYRLRRRHWFMKPPFLPLPGYDYWEFRMSTVMGKSAEPIEPRELVAAAKWSLLQPSKR